MQEDDIRRAQLRAGAEALVAWIHARRETWPELPPEAAPAPILDSPQLVAKPPPSPIPASPSLYDAEIVGDPEPAAIEPAKLKKPKKAKKPKKPAISLQIPTAAIRSFAAPLLRQLRRAAAVAAILAAVAVAGSLARPYWAKMTTRPTTGTVVLESVPPGSQVLVDGAILGTAPLTAELSPGPHVVLFRQKNLTRNLDITVKAGESTVGRLDWSVAETGRLMVRSEPAGVKVLVDGRERGVTPLALDLALGSHAVVLQGEQGSVRRTVAVTADGTALVSESIFAGWLKLFAPFELQITEGKRTIRLDDQDQVLLSAGSHNLQLENRALGYRESRRVEIEPGKTTSLSLVPSPSTLTVTSTLPATVMIDGGQAGETPLTDHPIALGTRDIVVKSATGPERRFTTRVTVTPVRIDVDFSQP